LHAGGDDPRFVACKQEAIRKRILGNVDEIGDVWSASRKLLASPLEALDYLMSKLKQGG